ncbi:hypothetical protein EG68_00996 [Paragonimus skrjabini miyazakii]|uniref:Cyclic nucleotide-binding domain-containing protein n=1 Tax=Paragonimus skrjabini miyazakii TaxID=59628 RepID=A0A8S9Z2G1_9TREM|nr:hypothetical protein EG68_00996 [Paragonimus skrjabini miyazakii]
MKHDSPDFFENKRLFKRRVSIAAEPFDPEKFDELEIDNDIIVHAKTDEQRKLLKEVCKTVVLFRGMDEEELDRMIEVMFARTVQPGDKIIVQGDDADNFYVVEQGTFHAFVKDEEGQDKQVCVYTNEGYFGELALMYNAPRSATVIAQTDGRIWCMSRKAFRKFVLSHASKQRRAFVKILHSVQMLQELSPYERMNLADALVKKTFQDNECIIREGDPGMEMFFIMEGSVTVKKNDGTGTGNSVTISKLGVGQYFGELALLSDQPRAASVYANGKSVLAVLDVESFERLLGPCVAVMKRNTRQYGSTVLNENNQKVML